MSESVAVPDVGDHLKCVSVNCSVVGDDFLKINGIAVLGQRDHFYVGMETGTFFLIDHIDFNAVGLLDNGLCWKGRSAKIVHCFVGNSHLQI